MFRLSRKGEYALRTIFHLSVRNSMCTTEEIARIQEVPQQFLKKIIQTLRVSGFISSAKGKSGGVTLSMPPEKITPWEIIEKIEGPLFLNDCLICNGQCPRDEICSLHEMWVKCQDAIKDILNNQNFSNLVSRHMELVRKKHGDIIPELSPLSVLEAMHGKN